MVTFSFSFMVIPGEFEGSGECTVVGRDIGKNKEVKFYSPVFFSSGDFEEAAKKAVDALNLFINTARNSLKE